MTAHTDHLRTYLAKGPAGARQLIEKMGVSQPTLSRAVSAMGSDVVRIGAARSIQYALKDTRRGLDEVPIYRVGGDGKIMLLGVLVPVRPDGFVMQQADGVTLHSDSLPWWLLDMRPQGFLGRAYAARHAARLGLPSRLSDWHDTHVLQALTANGHDAVGNLLVGDTARDHFVNAALPEPIPLDQKGDAYVRLAREAASGDVPGSSAGGEQPKFVACVASADGPRHVLVKFTEPEVNPVTQRWRDLLLAEHHALETLAGAGIAAAHTQIIDHAGQRFLEVERFDRVGLTGRRGLFSLASVEAEFAGKGSTAWPGIAATLASDGHIHSDASETAALLYAFGILTGNTDMHNGNLSFVSELGRPYALAPAYDMLPMGFAPKAGGGLPEQLPPANLHPSVKNATWFRALALATCFLERVQAESRFSEGFRACIGSLAAHIAEASQKVSRLA